ncbi:uncharacterized protein V2V93DRAFT_350375 [Kockiozyma suomiensis]|uniref:uncharacterized protein n=1 Tax=Kockiozyma suomiensis TaxID=1337062 RepID=UPI003343D3A8
MDSRLFSAPDRQISASPTSASPTITTHRAHLSHYISQLTSLEREQQRLALEQQLLARRQSQLTAKRDQLTYLIAEEQDLVLRAVQQQRQQEREEHDQAVALFTALAQREAQIARRQRLRYAVYRKQQEERAIKDAEIQRILRYVQPRDQPQTIPGSSSFTLPSQQHLFQNIVDNHHAEQPQISAPGSETSELDETPFRPGSISSFLRQQGIKPRELYSTRGSPRADFKRGSRRGSSVVDKVTPSADKSSPAQTSEFNRESTKLIPDVNYESAQDLLTALFGSASQAEIKREIPEQSPPAKQQKTGKSTPANAPSFDELMRMMFGGEQLSEQDSSSISAQQDQPPQTPYQSESFFEPPSATRPPFHYTLSHSKPSVPPPKFEIPSEPVKSPFEIIESQIATVRSKVAESAAKIDSLASQSVDTPKKHELLEIQAQLEKDYSDLDDILLTTPEAEDEDEETKNRRQELRLMKHEVTTMAVNAADKIDKILSPSSASESEEDDEGYEVIEEESKNIDSVPSNGPAIAPSEAANVGEEVIEDGDYFVMEKPAKDVTLERAETEEDESLDNEEKNEVKVPLNIPISAVDDDDTSVIVQASQPISRDENAEEVFVLESGDKSGHVLLETNSGAEKEEFLDNEEKNEQKISSDDRSRSGELKKEESRRSESPLRHVVLEDAPEDE